MDMSTSRHRIPRNAGCTVAILVLGASVLVEAPSEGVAAENAKSVMATRDRFGEPRL